jgi:CheY-like chemotaxis protein
MDDAPRVLVVDDDASIRECLCLALGDEGYAVAAAVDGLQALTRIKEAPPDLILLDMNMPSMDGWEFVRAYRHQAGPHAPIIVMTAHDAAARATQVGVASMLTKPFELDEITGLIQSLLASADPRWSGARSDDLHS